MASLINKQLLLTAYAYLFIMEQQKGQQGNEALQVEQKYTSGRVNPQFQRFISVPRNLELLAKALDSEEEVNDWGTLKDLHGHDGDFLKKVTNRIITQQNQSQPQDPQTERQAQEVGQGGPAESNFVTRCLSFSSGTGSSTEASNAGNAAAQVRKSTMKRMMSSLPIREMQTTIDPQTAVPRAAHAGKVLAWLQNEKIPGGTNVIVWSDRAKEYHRGVLRKDEVVHRMRSAYLGLDGYYVEDLHEHGLHIPYDMIRMTAFEGQLFEAVWTILGGI